MPFSNFGRILGTAGCLLFLPLSAPAATILIVTDQQSGERAAEIAKAFQTTPPFSLLKDFQVVVRVVDKTNDSCRGGSSRDIVSLDNDKRRMVVCTFGPLIAKLTKETNADRTLFVQETSNYGGSGGSVAVVTTGSPVNTALHETLHTFGMADEYTYETAEEADLYCPLYKHAPNLAVFNDSPPYASDGDARGRHAAQIAWYSQILPSTPITAPFGYPNPALGNLRLGTPTNDHVIGLFPGFTCDKSTLKLKSWVPGGSHPAWEKRGVMQDATSNYISEAMWPVIAEGLHTTLNPAVSPSTADGGAGPPQAAPAR